MSINYLEITHKLPLVFLDWYQSEQFGFWLRHYPNSPLPAEIFYNLIIYPNVLMRHDALHVDEIIEKEWKDEAKWFFENKIFTLNANSELSVEETSLLMIDNELNFQNTCEFEDVIGYNYSIKNSIPFCFSNRLNNYAENIANKNYKVFQSHANIKKVEKKYQRIAEWTCELNVPSIYSRSIKKQEELINEANKNGYWSGDKSFDTLLTMQLHGFLERSIFISPKELKDILSYDSQIEKLRDKIKIFAEKIDNKYELADKFIQIKEKLDLKLKICDFGFVGIDLALMSFPIISLVSKPFDYMTNRLIKKDYNWLFFLNKINKQIRK